MLINDFFARNSVPDSANADIVRPELAKFFLQDLLFDNANMRVANVEVQDYIVQKATKIALEAPQNHQQERFSQVERGKQWMLGYVDWYCGANSELRDREDRQPDVNETLRNGVFAMAREKYRGIPWTKEYIRRHDSLWSSPAVSADDLNRIDRFMDRCTVQHWHNVRGAFGIVRMPETVTYSGKTMKLGWEITHDWILPKDNNHGVSLLTLSFLLGEIDKLLAVGHSTQKDSRQHSDGFQLKMAGKDYVISIGKGTGAIITCYSK